MSTTRHTPTQNDTGFQLKGGLYPLTSILLGSTEPHLLAEFIDSKIKQAPKFFQNSPVVIDLHRVAESLSSLNLQMLKSILTERHLIPVGVRGGNPEQQAAAVSLGLAVLPENSKEGSIEKSSAMHEVTETHFPAQNIQAPSTINKVTNTKVITEPVRSGQQFYARGGDLIVLSSVSHGAELLADGHIHIYGPLRGRALAGVTGDTSAHIFCQSLEAELISIAGQYKISEDIEQSFWRLAVDISFHEGRLHIQPL